MKSIKMSNGMPPKIVIFEANMKSSTITENLIQYSSFQTKNEISRKL